MDPLDVEARAKVDEALRAWRQGDCVLDEQWFVFRISIEAPLTDAAAIAAAEQSENAESEVFGLSVLTQTCDLVRGCEERPFVEVCPLVQVDGGKLHEIERGRRPNYAFIAGLSDRLLVADLDRVMTVEKAVVAGWERIPGCQNDEDARRLALALARKRARAAFPDDFVRFVSALTSRMASKHDKESDEGRALRALREIRIRAAPSWYAKEIRLTFWFIRNENEPTFEQQGWDYYLEEWLKRIQARDRFIEVDGVVQTLDDLTARDYVESDRLDLDHLSTRNDGR